MSAARIRGCVGPPVNLSGKRLGTANDEAALMVALATVVETPSDVETDAELHAPTKARAPNTTASDRSTRWVTVSPVCVGRFGETRRRDRHWSLSRRFGCQHYQLSRVRSVRPVCHPERQPGICCPSIAAGHDLRTPDPSTLCSSE